MLKVKAIKNRDNAASDPYAGFYGSGSLNMRRIKYGDAFFINATPCTEEVKARRKDYLDKGAVSFKDTKGNVLKKDEEAYLKYTEFGTWMTLDLAYKVPVHEKKVQAEPKTVHDNDDEGNEGDAPVTESLEVRTGKERSGAETVSPAPEDDPERLREPVGGKKNKKKK